MNAVVLYLLLLRAVVGAFSGFTSVPLVREDFVVRHHLITDAELNAALAIGQTAPGPAALYVVVVGYFAGGTTGAIAGAAALATPALLVIPLIATARRISRPHLDGAARGIVIATAVLTLMTALELLRSAAPSPTLALIAIAVIAAHWAGRLPPLPALLLAGAAALFFL